MDSKPQDYEPLVLAERARDLKIPIGIKNIGNTCYFSCIAQIISFLPAFQKKILEFDEKSFDVPFRPD